MHPAATGTRENLVHGHDVLHLVAEAGRALTRTEIESVLVGRFGRDARYFTCSAAGMTAAEIVEFLAARGKLVESDGGLTTDRGRMCSHDGDHAH